MDNIADTLTIIRNGLMARKETIKTPYSRVIVGIAEVLKKEGWVSDFEVKDKGSKSFIIFTLKYGNDASPAISAIQRISKPGKRIYVSLGSMPTVRSGYGIAILSTPKGIMTAREAKRQKVGGEVLCTIY